MRKVRAPIVVLGFCLLLALPASAFGAAGDVAQLSGADGCIQNPPLTDNTCASALAGSISQTYSVAVTPDGKNAYGLGYNPGSMDAFSRSSSNGALTEIQCVMEGAAAPCSGGAHEVGGYVVLANDQSVYSVGSSGISEFSRDSSTGLLTYIGCIGAYFQCTANTVGNAYNGALSPDGKNVYTVDPGGMLEILTRDTNTGLLSSRGCLNTGGTGGCAASAHLAAPFSVTVSPDGQNVYVGDGTGSSYPVIAYARDTTTGDLTFLNCLNITGSGGCGQGYALGYYPRWTTVSPDGKNVYVADQGLGGIAVLQRSSVDGSISQSSSPSGCVQASGTACNTAIGLHGPWNIQVSPDNANAYVADTDTGNLLAFSRDAGSGALTQLATTPCIGQSPCAAGRAMGGFRGLAISPDGTNVYGAAFTSEAIDAFSRELAQPPSNTGTTGTTGTTGGGGSGGGSTSTGLIQTPPSLVIAPGAAVLPRPGLSALQVSPRRFRAARSGNSVTTSPKSGAKVSFRLTLAAQVRFTVERQTQGRRVGSRCQAMTRKNRTKRRCNYWKAVSGSFTVNGKAGSNSLRFSGRLNGSSLGAGVYRLTATPTSSGRAGKGQTTTFTIKR